jgi:hypothetical protein
LAATLAFGGQIRRHNPPGVSAVIDACYAEFAFPPRGAEARIPSKVVGSEPGGLSFCQIRSPSCDGELRRGKPAYGPSRQVVRGMPAGQAVWRICGLTGPPSAASCFPSCRPSMACRLPFPVTAMRRA